MKFPVLIIAVLIVNITLSHAQKAANYAGTWTYEVKNTPYGNFYGKIYLTKANNSYTGKIINKAGKQFKLEVVRAKADKLVLKSDVEETNSLLSCYLKGDSLFANVEVEGDSFPYKLKARRDKGK